jgi:hypothetical protein
MNFSDGEDPLAAARGIITGVIITGVATLLMLIAFVASAMAQNQPSNCGDTVGGTAAPIVFAHPPTQYITISNPNASATLWVSPVGTAVVNGGGTIGLTAAGATVTLAAMPTLSIIASASTTPYTCFYR